MTLNMRVNGLNAYYYPETEVTYYWTDEMLESEVCIKFESFLADDSDDFCQETITVVALDSENEDAFEFILYWAEVQPNMLTRRFMADIVQIFNHCCKDCFIEAMQDLSEQWCHAQGQGDENHGARIMHEAALDIAIIETVSDFDEETFNPQETH